MPVRVVEPDQHPGLIRVELGRDAEQYRSWLLQGLRRLFSPPDEPAPPRTTNG